jgi:hypothetical protein
MNTDEIIRMAQQADCRRINDYYTNGTQHSFDDAALQRFASLVAAAEREACAKVCESLFDMADNSCNEAEQCAAAIRARGNE